MARWISSGNCPSNGEPKSNTDPPKMIKNSEMPPNTITVLRCARNISELSFICPAGAPAVHIFISAIAASSGAVHSTITSIIDTVRNLSYPGNQSKNSRVNHMKLLPHASIIATIETPAIHHVLRRGSMNSPRIARNNVAAPR